RAVRVVLDLVVTEGCDLRQLARLDGIPPDGVLLRQRHFAGSDPRAADREVDLARAKGNTVHADALAVRREPLDEDRAVAIEIDGGHGAGIAARLLERDGFRSRNDRGGARRGLFLSRLAGRRQERLVAADANFRDVE